MAPVDDSAGDADLVTALAAKADELTRELQTLAAFDVVQLRRGLAGDLGRFAGAAALSEVMLKMAPPAPLPAAYEAFILGLDALVNAEPGAADAVAVRWLWLLVGD